jgi:large subunit ribosomal protein L10
MNKSEKHDIVAGLADRLTQSGSLYLTDFTGLSVKSVTELRRRIRANGAQFIVAKNTLALRAFHQASVEGLDDMLRGPTGFVLGGADPITTARVLIEFQNEEGKKPAIKAGLVDGRRVGADEVKRLALLPSRDQLMAQMAGALQAPLQGFVGVLNGMLFQVVGALEALRAQRQDDA